VLPARRATQATRALSKANNIAVSSWHCAPAQLKASSQKLGAFFFFSDAISSVPAGGRCRQVAVDRSTLTARATAWCGPVLSNPAENATHAAQRAEALASARVESPKVARACLATAGAVFTASRTTTASRGLLGLSPPCRVAARLHGVSANLSERPSGDGSPSR
jgi:hypothetical protein